MKGLHTITFIVLLIGGINWLLVGLFSWDVGMLFGGQQAAVSRLIYIVVGVAAILELATHKKYCKECTSGKVGKETPQTT